jgi:hypothetical protein
MFARLWPDQRHTRRATPSLRPRVDTLRRRSPDVGRGRVNTSLVRSARHRSVRAVTLIVEPESADRYEVVRRATVLNRLTIGWNAVEGITATAAGVAASSASLIGFGLDSGIEVSAALVLAWRLHQERRDGSTPSRRSRTPPHRMVLRSTCCVRIGVGMPGPHRTTRARGVDHRHRHRITLARGDAPPRCSKEAARSLARLASRRRRGCADERVHHAVRGPPRRIVGECGIRLVVGRPGRRAGDRWSRRMDGMAYVHSRLPGTHLLRLRP